MGINCVFKHAIIEKASIVVGSIQNPTDVFPHGHTSHAIDSQNLTLSLFNRIRPNE